MISNKFDVIKTQMGNSSIATASKDSWYINFTSASGLSTNPAQVDYVSPYGMSVSGFDWGIGSTLGIDVQLRIICLAWIFLAQR